MDRGGQGYPRTEGFLQTNPRTVHGTVEDQLEFSRLGINPKYIWVLLAGPSSRDGVCDAALGEVFICRLHSSNLGSSWKNKVPVITPENNI